MSRRTLLRAHIQERSSRRSGRTGSFRLIKHPCAVTHVGEESVSVVTPPCQLDAGACGGCIFRRSRDSRYRGALIVRGCIRRRGRGDQDRFERYPDGAGAVLTFGLAGCLDFTVMARCAGEQVIDPAMDSPVIRLHQRYEHVCYELRKHGGFPTTFLTNGHTPKALICGAGRGTKCHDQESGSQAFANHSCYRNRAGSFPLRPWRGVTRTFLSLAAI